MKRIKFISITALAVSVGLFTNSVVSFADNERERVSNFDIGDTVSVSTDNGNFDITIDAVKLVEPFNEEEAEKNVNVLCVIDNHDYQSYTYDGADRTLSLYTLSQMNEDGLLFKIEDLDGFTLDQVSWTPNNDGAYDYNDVPVNSKARVLLPFETTNDCSGIKITINDYSVLDIVFDSNGIGYSSSGNNDPRDAESDSAKEIALFSEEKEDDVIEESSDELQKEIAILKEENKELKQTIKELQDQLSEVMNVDEEDVISETTESFDENDISEDTVEETAVEEIPATEEYNDTPASDFLYVTNEGKTVIRSYKGNSSIVVIPREIDGSAVTTIAEKAFVDNENIQKVVFPDTIQEINESAFEGCSSLTEVVFPKTMLQSVTFGRNAFYLCDLTEPLIIYAGKIMIGPNAFCNNYNLTKIMLLSDSIVFQDSPFKYCKEVTQFFMYPDTETSYDGYYSNSTEGDVFEALENLEDVFLPSNCSFLTENSFVETPKAVIYAEENAPVVSLANSLWIPTNCADFPTKSEEILSTLEAKGYKRIVAIKDKETIQTVQAALNALGYDCGTPDGVAGQKTSDAISAYQTEKGIQVNGIITQELLDFLIEDMQ